MTKRLNDKYEKATPAQKKAALESIKDFPTHALRDMHFTNSLYPYVSCYENHVHNNTKSKDHDHVHATRSVRTKEKTLRKLKRELQQLGDGSAFKLHSNPSCISVMYLDFNGEDINYGWAIGSTGKSDQFAIPFSQDSDYNTFTVSEENYIREVWIRVSEYYSPWCVDVTTEQPAGTAYSWPSTTLHCVFTINNATYNWPGIGAGGIAIVGAYNKTNTPDLRPAFVFYDGVGGGIDPVPAAVASAHELGHNMGLQHQIDNDTKTYFPGIGSGTTGWAPIMGDAYYDLLRQWSDGNFTNSGSSQHDLDIIGLPKGLPLIPKGPTVLVSASSPGCTQAFTATNIIRTPLEIDTYTINVPSTAILNIAAHGLLSDMFDNSITQTDISTPSMLNIELGLMGNTINPIGDINASVSQSNVPAGNYPLTIRGGGESSSFTNYSNYGSIGHYYITICLIFNVSTANCSASDGPCCNPSTLQFSNSSVVCRASAGPCDRAENCSGLNATCPADTFLNAGSICRIENGTCDIAEACNGTSAACPADKYMPSGTICRSPTDLCDATENCTGTSPTCPADTYLPNGTICRNANGVCDITETCNGTSTACPPDAVFPNTKVCRPATGQCDVPEKCNGIVTTCPANVFIPSTVVCRPAAQICDNPEKCPGNGPTCPADTGKPAGTPCTISTGSGSCSAGNPGTCQVTSP